MKYEVGKMCHDVEDNATTKYDLRSRAQFKAKVHLIFIINGHYCHTQLASTASIGITQPRPPPAVVFTVDHIGAVYIEHDELRAHLPRRQHRRHRYHFFRVA